MARSSQSTPTGERKAAEPTGMSSRLSGFYKKTFEERLAELVARGWLDERAARGLRETLPLGVADRMSENVIAVHGMPLSVALNFRINQRDLLVPMSVEEPSVVAAASNAARIVRITGGFRGEADEPVMTAQVQLDQVPDPERAPARVLAHRAELMALADHAIPRMVARGGGCRDLDVRVLAEGDFVVVHLHVAVGDAMGANLVDTVAEAVAPRLAEILDARIGLRILTNLPLRRRVRVSCDVSADALAGRDAEGRRVDGAALADAIARASAFAVADPFRAVTHNKGVMNGIDAVAVALGQDWRAIEAGAHAFAALHAGGDTGYGPLATWQRTPSGLQGVLEMPMAVATVGGSTGVHPGVRVGLALVGAADARELAVVMGAAGLASNLAALRALAGEGIQRGHMRLHARKSEAARERARNGGTTSEGGGA